MVPELGCLYTASRDGLVQLWAGPHPARQLKFQLSDEEIFGMADDELDRLVKEFHQFVPGESKRMARISTISRVISGDISLSEVRLPERLKTIF